MIVGFGELKDKPEGALCAFSVDTMEEAKQLLVLTCPKNYNNEFVAPELVEEQTLENLYAFGDRLQKQYDYLMKERR